MNNENDHEINERRVIFSSFLFPLIKYLNENEVNTESLSKSEFTAIVNQFGKDDDYSIQIHNCPFESHKAVIESAIERSRFISASALIAITLEEDVNSYIRMGCFAKGYTHRQITKFISELGLKSKIDLVLPLLGYKVPEEYRSVVFDFLPLRNQLVHGKALPSLHTDHNDKPSSSEINDEKAKRLVLSYPIDKIYKYSMQLNSSFLTDIPQVKRAVKLLDRYVL